MDIKKLLQYDYDTLVKVLLEKYGPVKKDYFYNNINWNTRTEIKRGNEGLYIHHIDEDKAIMLSSKEWAKQNPWHYQTKERLVYANLLEHLILHIKITEIKNWPQNDGANEFEIPGIGGIYNFIIPELNDIYSGIEYKENWKQKMAGFLKPLENDYFEIIKYISKLPWINDYFILKSFNEKYGLWSDEKNQKTYEKIMEIIPGQKLLKEKIAKDQQKELKHHEQNNLWEKFKLKIRIKKVKDQK